MSRARVRKDGAFIQRQRINDMIKDLSNEFRKDKWGGQIRLRWFQAKMQVDYGLNFDTTRRYLSSMEELEMIMVNDQADEGKGIIMQWYDKEAIKGPITPEDEKQDDG